uniref:Uncharacterized protein n=1 Tax=Acrobeloides nanus TaxID=290746 RepID=A0A914BY76_9BILA
MFGSSARMVGPIAISTLYSGYGPRMAWIMEIIVIFSTLLLWYIFYRRMVPLRCAKRTVYGISDIDANHINPSENVEPSRIVEIYDAHL